MGLEPFFAGEMDEFYLFSKSLSNDEVKEVMKKCTFEKSGEYLSAAVLYKIYSCRY